MTRREPSDINFGGNSSGNSLLVTNGGQVLGYYAYLGRMSTSDNNSALVTGPGSSFSVNCYIYTGNQGHNNTFTAANGAAISDKFCYISYVGRQQQQRGVAHGHQLLLAEQLERVRGLRRWWRQASPSAMARR